MTNPIDLPIIAVPGIGPKKAQLLANLNIRTVRDLLWHFPREYKDRSEISSIAGIRLGDFVTIKARVLSAQLLRPKRNVSLLRARLSDDTGSITAVWFNQRFLKSTFVRGKEFYFSGKVGEYDGPVLENPEYEPVSENDPLGAARIVPVYPLTEGVFQKQFRKWTRAALEMLDYSNINVVPPEIAERRGLLPTRDALETIRFPDSLKQIARARTSLAFEEFLVFQTLVCREKRKQGFLDRGFDYRTNGWHLGLLKGYLPFSLTDAQSGAVEQIFADMRGCHPMNRLLHGDVGCGKTEVALHAMLAAVDSGFQAALMAPTEVLAEQHYRKLKTYLDPLGVPLYLLTSGVRGPERAKVRRSMRDYKPAVFVGTHALIEKDAEFGILGLVVVDEQHRFGVEQRSLLALKAMRHDVLHMTATPIPRSLALTLFGAMDITVIDQMPPGRQPVETSTVPPENSSDLHQFIRERVHNHEQVFYVCPVIEDSEKWDVRGVVSVYKWLAEEVFPDLRVGLLHGKMPFDERQRVISQFAAGQIDVLVATTVVEVGVDVPNATVMAISGAEKFGLSQLHQLRGRVGRGNKKSYCFLLPEAGELPPRTWERLSFFCQTNDGFEIAEKDMIMRGPGEMFGNRQSGLPDFKAGDLLKDVKLMELAREDAEALLRKDMNLENPDNAGLKEAAERFGYWIPEVQWADFVQSI